MLKKIFLISFLFVAFVSNAQFQKPIGYGFEYRGLVVDTLFAFPSDTFTIAANLKSYMWAARKGDSVYVWSPVQDKWILNGGGSSGGGGFFSPNQTSTGNTLHNGDNHNFEVDSASNMTFRLKKDNFSQYDIYAGRGFFAAVEGVDSDGDNYYGYYDLFDIFNEFYLQNGSGETKIAMNPDAGVANMVFSSKVSGNGSFLGIEDDRIYIDARNGVLQLGNLTNLSTQDRLLGQYNSSTQVGYTTIGVGLSLAAGALGVNATYTSTATGITLDATHQVVNVTATGQTIIIPSPSGITGRVYTIKLTASGSCTVSAAANIDGAATYSLASQYKYVSIMSTGSTWMVIANN